MRKSGRELLMRRISPKPGEDWFRIIDATADDGDENNTKVYIYDEIGYWGTSADDFVRQMMAISSPNIEVHLNSPGGEIFDGVAIYNALKTHPANVSVYVDGLAASAASFISQAASPGNLFMTRHATMMIHDGLGMTMGNAEDHREMADILDKLSDNIADMYAQRAGGEVADWRALMKEETWYSSSEAVAAKLADSIANEDGEDTTDKWDLSVFNHAGRKDAPSPLEVREKVLVNHATQGGTVVDTATTEPNAGGTPATPPTPPAPPAAPAAPVVENVVKPAVFNIGGREVSDPREVQNHITTLETFQNETVVQGRKNFVASLAAGSRPKVAASQIESLEAFALDLSPDQFVKWQASWDAAPASSVLGNHAVPQPNADGTTPAGGADIDPVDDRIEVLNGIVKQHKLANMPQDKIEKTASWQELQNLLARKRGQ